MKAVQQRETLLRNCCDLATRPFSSEQPHYHQHDRALTNVVLAGESRIIDEARERQREFEASAYAHRQRMILDLQVMQPTIVIVIDDDIV
jgi:hypothetical protein